MLTIKMLEVAPSRTRTVLVSCWLLGVLVCLEAGAFAQMGSPELPELRSKWSQSLRALEGGRLEYLLYQAGYDFPPLRRNVILKTLRSLDFSPGKEEHGIRAFAHWLTETPLPQQPKQWPRSHFMWSGKNVRDSQGPSELIVADGVEIQKDLVNRGGSRKIVTVGAGPNQLKPLIPGLSDFVWVPNETFFAEMDVEILAEGDLLKLQCKPIEPNGYLTELTVDPETADVLGKRTIRKDGSIADELVQLRFARNSGSVRLPTVYLSARYDAEELLQTVYCRIIVSADLETPVTDEDFDVSADAGDVLVDHRIGERGSQSVEYEIADVRKMQAADIERKELGPGKERFYVILLVVNGVFLVALGWWLIRRKRRAHSERNS